MPKKSIYWGTLILLLFSTVATAGIFDDEEDEDAGSGAQTAVEENSGGSETNVVANSAKTSKHTMSVSVKNGKAVSPDNEIQVDTDSEIETGDNGKYFWKVEDLISFSFHLPNNASVRVKCALNDEYTGKALIRWNGKALLDENGKRKVFTFDGSNGFFEIPDLKTDRKENTLTFICTDGEIGLESLTIYSDIEYPSFDFNGMVIQMTSPRPGAPLDGKPVSICWEVTKGLADGGWVRVWYRTPDMKDWQVVPGMEGITYGAKNWGEFTWENPPKAQTCEFKFEYTRGENPEDVRRAEEEAKRQAIKAAIEELIPEKKALLDSTNTRINSMSKYLKEYQELCRKPKANLKKHFKEEEKDYDTIIQTINELEQLYFKAFEKMMSIALDPTLEEKEREDIQNQINNFWNELHEVFDYAYVEYGDGEYTKELIPRMFPKEPYEKFKKAKEEFDSELKLLNPKPGFRRVWKVNGVEFAFHWCPAGTFTMGSPDSEEGHEDKEIQHQVTLTKGFWIMETEVTVGMFRAFVNDTNYESSGGEPFGWAGSMFKNDSKFSWRNPGFSQDDNHPVTCVSWNDAVEFCKWLSRKTGQNITLPTEAQWEYACRAGSTGVFSGDLDDIAWYRDKKGVEWWAYNNARTYSIKTKKPNAWGLFDMHGNVSEWCQDLEADYPSGSVTDPAGPSDGSCRVHRGGSWFTSSLCCRAAFRGGAAPELRVSDIGFRCVMSITHREN